MDHRSYDFLRDLYSGNIQYHEDSNFSDAAEMTASVATQPMVTHLTSPQLQPEKDFISERLIKQAVGFLPEADLDRFLDEANPLGENGDLAAADWTTSVPAAGCDEISVPVPLLHPMNREISDSSFCSNMNASDFRPREISTSSMCSNIDFSDFRAREVSTSSFCSNVNASDFRAREVSTSSMCSNIDLSDFRAREVSTSSLCSNANLGDFRGREFSATSLCAGIDFSDFRIDCVTNDDPVTDAKQLSEEKMDTVTVPTIEMKMERCSLSSSKAASSEAEVVPEPPAERPRKSNGTPRVRIRKRPLKNVREKRRRAEIKEKYEQLHKLCQFNVGAKGLSIPLSGNEVNRRKKNAEKNRHKMDILSDVIKSMETMDKELIELRTHNKKLKSSSTFK